VPVSSEQRVRLGMRDDSVGLILGLKGHSHKVKHVLAAFCTVSQKDG